MPEKSVGMVKERVVRGRSSEVAVVKRRTSWVMLVKEEVRKKKSEEVVRMRRSGEVVVGRRGSWVMVVKEEVRGRRWGRTHKEPLLSNWVSPGKGTSGLGSSPRELVRGSVERGTVWSWGSGQEALIHPRTRSVFCFFFFLTRTKGEKNHNTGFNRLIRLK